MITINCIYKNKDDLTESRTKAVSYPPNKILIQVFSGVLDVNAISLLQSDLQETFPGATVIGTTTSGEIINGKVNENSIIVSVSFFEKTEVHSHVVINNDDVEKTTSAIVSELKDLNPKALIVFGAQSVNNSVINDLQFLEIINQQLKDTIVAGGQAGENLSGKKSFIFNDSIIIKNGYLAVALTGPNIRIKNDFSLGWVPIGKQMMITKSKGNRVFSIDNIPVNELYKHYLGITERSIQINHPILQFPFLVERNGIAQTILPANENPDGSYDFLQPLHQGEKVCFSYRDSITLIENLQSLRSRINQYQPETIFVYSCGARKRILEENIHYDEEILKYAPSSAGFFSYGEYYTDNQRNIRLFSQTMTILILSEAELSLQTRPETAKKLSVDDFDTSKLQVQKVLRNLLSRTTKELELKNEELMNLANNDPMTGLANRRNFDETLLKEVRRHSRTGQPFSLIMLDVDFFKQFNDRYGHVAGDDCLRSISQVLKKIIQRPFDLPFRYGGEEFGSLLPATNLQGATQLAEEIRLSIEQLEIPSEGSHVSDWVTVSLGVITARCTEQTIPMEIVNGCDELLYEAKRKGRNCVVAKEYVL